MVYIVSRVKSPGYSAVMRPCVHASRAGLLGKIGVRDVPSRSSWYIYTSGVVYYGLG